METTKVNFAELDGPFTVGNRNGVEVSEFVITFFDRNDNEIGARGFASFEAANNTLNKLAAQGVEVGSLTAG